MPRQGVVCILLLVLVWALFEQNSAATAADSGGTVARGVDTLLATNAVTNVTREETSQRRTPLLRVLRDPAFSLLALGSAIVIGCYWTFCTVVGLTAISLL